MSTLKKAEAYLNNLRARGIKNLPVGSTLVVDQERVTTRVTPTAGSTAVPVGTNALEELKQAVMPCTLCKGLAKTRKNVVFGSGNPKAKLMFVGEAPGFDEDQQGLPFVGKAGQLLTKIIESIGLSRDEVYIANVLKCRPPENRNPLPDEVANCQPYLKKQIAIIQPKIICALGKFAAQTLLRTETPISKLRGKWNHYEGVKLMPTFHPAYLLRNPDDKKLCWEDMKMIREELRNLSA